MMKLKFLIICCFILSSVFCFSCVSSSISEQSALAQTNQSNTDASNKSQEIEILKGLSDPCRYQKPDYEIGEENTPTHKLYDLINGGFPKEISLEEGVAVFNKFAQCDKEVAKQPALTVDEVKAAIRDWDCTAEKEVINKRLCEDAWKIAETGKMPRGSLFDYDCGIGGTCRVRGYKGYSVYAWEIKLFLWLDKYRRDMKDEPVYYHTIRLIYDSSETEKERTKRNKELFNTQ